jgi:hypothetical protein
MGVSNPGLSTMRQHDLLSGAWRGWQRLVIGLAAVRDGAGGRRAVSGVA